MPVRRLDVGLGQGIADLPMGAAYPPHAVFDRRQIWPRSDEPRGAASWAQFYARRMPPSAGLAGRRGPERGREDLEVVVVSVPVAGGRRPVEGVGMARVGQDVPVQHLDHDAIPAVREFPVGGLLGLRIADRLEQDEMVAGVRALAVGRLLPPVRQRVGLGLIRLVDQQEYAAVGRVPDIYVVTIVRDLPAARGADREA